jgi:hypothetical protein
MLPPKFTQVYNFARLRCRHSPSMGPHKAERARLIVAARHLSRPEIGCPANEETEANFATTQKISVPRHSI